jgi:hypothetical protein
MAQQQTIFPTRRFPTATNADFGFYRANAGTVNNATAVPENQQMG